MRRLFLLALAVATLSSAQDRSRAIQAQQVREAEERGDQQRRDLAQQEHQREVQAREEQELAARRRAEAQAEQQRQRQQEVTQSPQPEQQPDPVSVPVTQPTEDSNRAGSVNFSKLELRVIRISLMALSAFSLLLLIHHRIRRT